MRKEENPPAHSETVHPPEDGDSTFHLVEHLGRHRLTANVLGTILEAACVCFARHHQSPTSVSVRINTETRQHPVYWESPDTLVRDSHRNALNATEDGAVAVSLVAVERRLGMIAVQQAAECSGADWIIAPVHAVKDAVNSGDWPEWESLDGAAKLEVSGIDTGPIGARFKKKEGQVRAGRASLIRSGYASVVGFHRRQVRVEQVDRVPTQE